MHSHAAFIAGRGNVNDMIEEMEKGWYIHTFYIFNNIATECMQLLSKFHIQNLPNYFYLRILLRPIGMLLFPAVTWESSPFKCMFAHENIWLAIAGK